MRLGKNELRMSSKTIISCSINFNVMEEVFKKAMHILKMGHILWVVPIPY